jgi:ATP-dependent exoDNAse (exonuclease V) beta subunit
VAQGWPEVGVLDAGEVLDRARDLARWLANAYPGARLQGELPFSRPLATGQIQSGQIDLALKLADGWVIVDHKSNPQPKAEWPRLAAEHSDQLAAYADALASLGGKPVRDTLIHFSVSGGLVRVSR